MSALSKLLSLTSSILVSSSIGLTACFPKPQIIERPVACTVPYPVPVAPHLTFIECMPDLVCLDKQSAAALTTYVLSVVRWFADYKTLCSEKS